MINQITIPHGFKITNFDQRVIEEMYLRHLNGIKFEVFFFYVRRNHKTIKCHLPNSTSIYTAELYAIFLAYKLPV
jgi:hypothetical protein